MLGFQQLGDEKVAIENESGQLSATLAQCLHRARSVDDVGVRRIGDQLVNVGGPKGTIALAKNDEIRVIIAQRFKVAAVYTAPIARFVLIKCQGACCFRLLERAIRTVVGNDDYAHYAWMA